METKNVFVTTEEWKLFSIKHLVFISKCCCSTIKANFALFVVLFVIISLASSIIHRSCASLSLHSKPVDSFKYFVAGRANEIKAFH